MCRGQDEPEPNKDKWEIFRNISSKSRQPPPPPFFHPGAIIWWPLRGKPKKTWFHQHFGLPFLNKGHHLPIL